MEVKTQEQLEQQLTALVNYFKENDPGLTGQVDPQIKTCDFEKRKVVFQFDKKDWQKNHRGEVHGGAVATMFDVAIGITCSAFAGGENVTTTDINISYIRPFSGDSFDFEVELIHLGRNMIRTRALARDTKTGKELASAISNYAHMHSYERIAAAE